MLLSHPRINWPPWPRAQLPAGDGVIHVFAASLTLPPKRLEELAKSLSPDEHARARQLQTEVLRHRFIAARGMLRNVLATLLDCPIGEIKFAFSPRGKPSLAAHPELHFNLAHSGDLALIAVSRLGPLGVDVEHLRDFKDAEAIANRFFSTGESAGLHALPAELRTAAFFHLWTRKEAWLKATGEGIGNSLREVEVSFRPDEPARIVGLFGNADAARLWTLHALEPAEGYVGALAVSAVDAEVHCWRLEE